MSQLDQTDLYYYRKSQTYNRDETTALVATSATASLGDAITTTDPGGSKPAGSFYFAPDGPGTYSHFLDDTATAITIPAPSAGHAILEAKLVSYLTYWKATWTDVTLPAATNKIVTWTATSFASGDQVNYNGVDYVASGAAISTDVPGVAALWVPRLDVIKKSTIAIKIGKNFFNPAKGTDGYYMENSNVASANALFGYSDYMPVTPGLVYYGSDGSAGMRKTCYYNSSKVLVAGGATNSVFSFTCPAGVAYVRVTYTLTGKATFQFEQAAAHSTFEAYFERMYSVEGNIIQNGDVIAYDKSVLYTKTQVDAMIPVVVTAVSGASKNLANPGVFTDGSFIENTGTITANVSYGYTDFIPVTPGLAYTGWDGVNGMRKTCYYDAGKNLVAGGSTSTVTTFTCPAGVYFVRVSYFVNRKANFQFEQSAAATSFIAFSASTTTLYSVNGALATGQEVWKRGSIANVETDVFFGDSYFDGPYKIKGKGVLNKLSMFTDRRIENYSHSGNTLANILTRIQTDNKTFHSLIGIKSYASGGYGFIGSWTNEFGTGGSMVGANDMDTYLTNLQRLCEAVRALGYKPVIYDEQSIAGSSIAQMGLAEFCSKHNYDFIDVKEVSNIIAGSTNNPKYYFGSHPGVRTDSIFWVPLLNYVRAMARPKTSLKIFRKRAATTVSTLADLLFTGLDERAKKYKEILIGQQPFSDATANNWDDLTNLANGAGFSGQYVCDYLKLQNRESLSFADYALVECIVNTTANRLTGFRLYLSDPTLVVYVIDWVNKTTVAITPTVGLDGKSYYVPTDFKNQMLYDKISFIVYATGVVAFNLTEVYFEYLGLEGKELLPRAVPVRSSAAEVLTNPAFDSTPTGWTATGTITPFTPTDTNVPLGADKVITVTTGNYVSSVFTFASNAERTRKAQVRVIARNVVADFPSGNSYPSTSPVTDDTFDMATLGVEIMADSSNIVKFSKLVGLHWTEVLMEIIIPKSFSSLTLTIKSVDLSIDVSKASVKIEA